LRVLRSKKKWAAATVGVVVIGTLATVALASHAPFGFVGEPPLVTANFDETVHLNSDRVKFQTKGPTDVRVQRFNVSPGGRSGWHHHPGMVIVTVASGSVIFTDSDCNSKTYGPGLPNGAVFVEYGDEPGQASSTNGATLYATFVAPSADPPVFRIDDHDFPGCP
jgi:hypothetical protein